MAKSSINFQKASINSKAHMLRISKVTYLLDNENSKNVFKEYLDANTFLEQAKIITKEKTKRSMQKLAIENFIQEAVLNIKEHTSIKDIENLFKKFNKEFGGGFKVFDIALHKDEGVFIDSKFNIDDLIWDSKSLKWFKENKDVTDEVFTIAPGRDIFYNADDKSWYKEKKFKQKIDTTKYQKFYNYHSHIRFTKFDENNGKNIRLSKSDLSKIQDITAKHLGMERGEKWSKNKRMTHWQKKALYDENTKQKTLKQATKKDLNSEIARLRKQLKEQGAVREQYAQLEQLNRELKEQIKAKDLTIEELKEKIKAEQEAHKETQKKLITAQKTILSQKATISSQKQKINELEANMSNLELDRDDYETSLSKIAQTVGYDGNDLVELENKVKTVKNERDSLLNVINRVIEFAQTNVSDTIFEFKHHFSEYFRRDENLKDYINDFPTKETHQNSNRKKRY